MLRIGDSIPAQFIRYNLLITRTTGSISWGATQKRIISADRLTGRFFRTGWCLQRENLLRQERMLPPEEYHTSHNSDGHQHKQTPENILHFH
jgi:hypothetical protein